MKYVYRIVNALLAAAIFPAVLFLDFLLVRASTSLADVGLEETITLKRIIDIFTGHDTLSSLIQSSGDFSWPEAFAPINSRLIACVVFFALALIAALFIIFWSIFSNKRIPVLSASIAGLVSVIVMNACFNSAAREIMSGTINIVQAFATGWIGSIVGSIVNIDTLVFGGFQNGMIILFVCLIIWTGAFYLVELGEPKEEKSEPKKK